MSPVTMVSQVAPDGTVSVALPAGTAEPGEEVLVTVAPRLQTIVGLSHEEWWAAFNRTEGSLADSDFRRPAQPVYESEPPRMTQGGWAELVNRTAGSISRDTFARPEQPPPRTKSAAEMTPAEWEAFVGHTAGRIQDPTFARPEQPPLSPAPEFD